MDQERFDKGLAARRDVLGAEYVDNALANAGEFAGDFQELLTEYCWGAVWGDDTLDRKTRSMLNVTMIAALNETAANVFFKSINFCLSLQDRILLHHLKILQDGMIKFF